MWKLSEHAQVLVQQLQDSLSSRPWVGKARHEEAIINLLDQIGLQGEPAAIPTLARCLFFTSNQLKLAASRTIHRLLSLVSPEQLTHLSGVIGWSWGWYISDAWDKLFPADLTTLLLDSGTRAAILGILSFHRNGYIRQEAVRLLADERDGSELPYLLIRQNDWVNVVSVEAQRAITDRLRPNYLGHFVRSLPLVTHLLEFRRRDLSPVFHKVIEMLVQPENDALLADAIGASNRWVCRQVVRTALGVPGEHHGSVIHYGLASTDAIVRLTCAEGLRLSPGDELHQAIAALQADRFMPVRREGFRIEADSFPDQALSAWERGLLDKSASIRDLARYSIRQITAFDTPAFYRKILAEKGALLPAAGGLAECGDSTDLPVLRTFLVHPRPSFRRAAIRGIARIAQEAAVAELVKSLQDTSPSVVRETKRQLEPYLNAVGGDVLLAVVRDASTEYARKCAIKLIFEKGKWQSLPWLIRATSYPDQAVAPLARRFIEEWFSPPLCNRVFTKPSVAERRAIEEAMSALPPEGGEDLLGKLQKWLQEK
jgi:HEAT repeat protein